MFLLDKYLEVEFLGARENLYSNFKEIANLFSKMGETFDNSTSNV